MKCQGMLPPDLEGATCQATIAEAISLAKALDDMTALAVALRFAAHLAHYERNPAEVERLASELIELSTRDNFAYWLAIGAIFRGWARSASGDTAEGIAWDRGWNRRLSGNRLDAERATLADTKGRSFASCGFYL